MYDSQIPLLAFGQGNGIPSSRPWWSSTKPISWIPRKTLHCRVLEGKTVRSVECWISLSLFLYRSRQPYYMIRMKNASPAFDCQSLLSILEISPGLKLPFRRTRSCFRKRVMYLILAFPLQTKKLQNRSPPSDCIQISCACRPWDLQEKSLLSPKVFFFFSPLVALARFVGPWEKKLPEV